MNDFARFTFLTTCMAGLAGCGSMLTTAPKTDEVSGTTSCYQDPGRVCYKNVIKRGRTLEAAYHSEEFKPFRELFYDYHFDPALNSAQRFEHMWQRNRAWVYASLSHAAYLEKDELLAMLEHIGAESDEKYIFRVKSHDGYLAVFTDKAILVFRGTQPDEIGDILTDADLIPVQVDGVRVHNGVYEATIAIWKGAGIKEKLDKVRKMGLSNIYASGHSLGAALAVVSGILYDFEEIVTFGQPKVAKDDIGTILKGCPLHLRYVNGNDRVPTLPFAATGWQHHGEEIAFVDKGGPWPWPVPILINVDHSPVNYAVVLLEQTPEAGASTIDSRGPERNTEVPTSQSSL